MLPDYPEIKNKLEKLLLRRASNLKNQYLGAFSEIPKVKLFEGDQMATILEDKEYLTEFRDITQEMTFQSNMSLKEMLKELDNSSVEFAKKEGMFTTESLFKASEEIGNNVETQGELKPEKWFELLEKIAIDFDEKQQPILPTMIFGNEKIGQEILKCTQTIDSDKNLQERYKEIIEKKRLKWNDREASRKLVD